VDTVGACPTWDPVQRACTVLVEGTRQMFENARRCGLVAGALVGAVAGVVGVAGATASAEPTYPLPPSPPQITQQAGQVPVAGTQSAVGTQYVAGAQSPVAGYASPAPAAAVAAPPTVAAATSVTITDFLKSKHVTLEPQVSKGFTALSISLPVPTGWSLVPDPNVPDAFAVIADRVGGDGLYTSNAALVVYKLAGGEFDPKEAISHGLIDSQEQTAWRSTDASLADFGGMPSAAIEGTYRQNNMTLNTTRRHVLATSGGDKYLVSLSITTSASVSVASGAATDAILHGFKVGSPDSPPPPPPAPAPPAPTAPATPTALPLTHQVLILPS
jgi:Probable lipoprotein LpqN